MSHLTKLEIEDLINRYRSEMRKLQYQINNVQHAINDLYSLMPDSGSVNGASPAKPAASAPSTMSTVDSPAKPAAAKEKVTTAQEEEEDEDDLNIEQLGKGYRLSDWDLLIINALKSEKKVLINSDLFEAGRRKVEKDGVKMSDQDIKGKLNRSLHKLANKRGALKKIPHTGRGFAYALSTWVDKNGNLKDKYQRN